MFPWYLQFSWSDLKSFPFYCFPLFPCIVHQRRLSYLSLLFSGSLHSFGYTYPFLFCFLLLFFSQLFVRPPSDNHFAFLNFFFLEMVWSPHPAMQEIWFRSLDWEDPLKNGMATHSIILAWRIPWTLEPGRPHSMGCQRVRWLGDFPFHFSVVLWTSP